MKLLMLSLMTILATAVYAADVSEIAFSRSDDSFPAYSGSGRGTVHLRSRHSMLAVHLPDGTPRKSELVVLF